MVAGGPRGQAGRATRPRARRPQVEARGRRDPRPGFPGADGLGPYPRPLATQSECRALRGDLNTGLDRKSLLLWPGCVLQGLKTKHSAYYKNKIAVLTPGGT